MKKPKFKISLLNMLKILMIISCISCSKDTDNNLYHFDKTNWLWIKTVSYEGNTCSNIYSEQLPVGNSKLEIRFRNQFIHLYGNENLISKEKILRIHKNHEPIDGWEVFSLQTKEESLLFHIKSDTLKSILFPTYSSNPHGTKSSIYVKL